MYNISKEYSYILLGPRQTGKSTLIRSILKDTKFWEVDLLKSDLYLKYLRTPQLFRLEAIHKMEKENIQYIFVDEIQRIPLLLNEVQYLMGKYPECKFFVTGSSARKLRRGEANLLAGRLIQRFLYPFTSLELGENFDLDNALRYGTMPSLFNKNNDLTKDILKSYTETYLQEEIQAEGIIRNLGGFSRFLEVTAAQCGELTNFSSIARDAGLPVRTVQSYFEILEDTLIALRVDGWRKSIRKRLIVHPRYYLFDTGVTNCLCYRLDSVPDNLLKGRLFEQWIILETHRILNYVNQSVRIFYWRTSAGAEVDMILVKGSEIIAACEIKFTSNISRPNFSGLKAFQKEHEKVSIYMVCMVDEPYREHEVEIIPWRVFFQKLIKGEL